MKNIVGIDLGTTFSAIAKLNQFGNPEIVPLQDGERTIASAIYFDDDLTLVGHAARQKSELQSKRYVELVKRYMGEEHYPKEILGKMMAPSKLSGIILAKIKEEYEVQNGPIDAAIVTVPAYFDDTRRNATLEAAKYAGLNVIGIVNEPTAAGLYYASEKDLEGKTLVFDLGGGTFDVTLLNIINEGAKKDIEIITSQGDHQLGGKDFDIEIARHMNDLIGELHGQKLVGNFEKIVSEEYEDLESGEKEFFNGLLLKAEDIKKELSKRISAEKLFFVETGQVHYKLSRDNFEKMIAMYFSKIEMLIENVLDDANILASDVDHIILVGGSSRLPIVEKTIESVLLKKPIRVGNLDESVALGAALYCGIQYVDKHGSDAVGHLVAEKIDNMNLVEVTNHSFGTFILEFDSTTDQNYEVNDIIIKKDTPIPCSVKKTYYTVADNQTKIDISITQGEGRDRYGVNVLRDMEMSLPGGREKGQPIEVTYSYDSNGMMSCNFFDVKSGLSEKVEIQHSSDDLDFDIDEFINF
jgi:molecular chaperone DnaK